MALINYHRASDRTKRPGLSLGSVLGVTAVVVVLTAVSCQEAGSSGSQAALALGGAPADTACDERFLTGPIGPDKMIFTTPPALLDREAALRAIEAAYPDDLRRDGVGGTVRLLFLIDREGRVPATRVSRSSGIARLDTAAMVAARTFRFSPPYQGREPTCTWLDLPIILSP